MLTSLEIEDTFISVEKTRLWSDAVSADTSNIDLTGITLNIMKSSHKKHNYIGIFLNYEVKNIGILYIFCNGPISNFRIFGGGRGGP